MIIQNLFYQLSLDNDTHISLVNLLQGGVSDEPINRNDEAMLMTNLQRIINRPEMNFEAYKERSLK